MCLVFVILLAFNSVLFGKQLVLKIDTHITDFTFLGQSRSKSLKYNHGVCRIGSNPGNGIFDLIPDLYRGKSGLIWMRII